MASALLKRAFGPSPVSFEINQVMVRLHQTGKGTFKMKSFFVALLALTFSAGIAHAQNTVEIPSQVNESTSLIQSIEELYAVQLTELSALEIQQKYFQIMRASFEGSHALSVAFDNEGIQAGANVSANGVQLVMDAYLAKMWLRGATPSFMALKDVYYAYKGQTSKLSVEGLTTLTALKELGMKVKVPKNVITTVALGGFAYIQYKNFWVINMSEAQYNETIRLLDVKIANIAARQAAIADTRGPLTVK
ncbi:hypothetical protein BH10BDE1_BH10BDE1_03050 [soil metagenome]